MKKLKVIELFSGIGAQHKALEIIKNKYGYEYEVVGTSEWAIKSILAYGSIHYDNKNIFKTKTKEQLLKIIKEKGLVFSNDGQSPMKQSTLEKKDELFLQQLLSANEKTKNLGSILDIKGEDIIALKPDLITYSFPCQDLSTGAQFTKGKTGLKGSRSGLLYEVERIISEMNAIDESSLPKFLLLENVAQLIKNPEFKKSYDIWLRFLYKKGYTTNTYLEDAKNFGIPQSRKRVFGLSVRNEKELSFNILKDVYNEKYDFRSKTLKQIINRKNHIKEQVDAMVKPTPSRERMRAKVPKLLETRFTHSNTLTKKHDRTPCPGTINMREFKNVLDAVAEYRADFEGYDYYYRFMTARETFIIMGFDHADWNKVKKLNYGIRSYYEMTGNSIVVNNLLPIFDEVFRIWNK